MIKQIFQQFIQSKKYFVINHTISYIIKKGQINLLMQKTNNYNLHINYFLDYQFLLYYNPENEKYKIKGYTNKRKRIYTCFLNTLLYIEKLILLEDQLFEDIISKDNVYNEQNFYKEELKKNINKFLFYLIYYFNIIPVLTKKDLLSDLFFLVCFNLKHVKTDLIDHKMYKELEFKWCNICYSHKKNRNLLCCNQYICNSCLERVTKCPFCNYKFDYYSSFYTFHDTLLKEILNIENLCQQQKYLIS